MTTTGGRTHRIYSVVVFIVLASLDNVAVGLIPPLYGSIADSFDVPQGLVGTVTAVSFLVSAVASVAWAYYGDRGNRKPLLMIGTVLWAAGMTGSGLAGTYLLFFVSQVAAAVGLGAVSSVGFSVVSDLIKPKRRGLVMSFWGLSQGAGTFFGTLIGGVLGASDWRRPFFVLSVVGLVATVAYFFTYDIRRGQSDTELAGAIAEGHDYDYRISRKSLPSIVQRRTNVWLILQGLPAQIAFGSLVWLPVLFRERAIDQGYPEHTAIVVGSIFATMFQLGGALSIVGGLVGDKLQRRTLRGRALVSAVGILAAVPLYLVLFFLPFKIEVPADAGSGAIVVAALKSVVTVPSVGITFLIAIVALALTSANSPNWFALIADINPPEYRGTVYSLGNLTNGVGRAIGNGLIPVAFAVLASHYASPLNYSVGLAAFQLFFIPTGIMYWLASRSSPRDIKGLHRLLEERAEVTAHTPIDDDAQHHTPR
ncbi:MFS transporter [Asanoa ferruginea]|uniref:MFS transporter n=1 Tax=Asanoa ferruginea TaxID=53367 RepID=A0A3D9ZAS8_9ACTN|nr:MFS transporter [Asanoa ferruginea]REF94508.1 MFS transporter [Asanoa ferruginea]GIF51606.1 MFS transporter [Asanoa ferruginea]